MAVTAHSEALLYNGLGRYEHAVTAAQRATSFHGDVGTSSWALVELIEAATRSGMAETAVGALARLTEMTTASGTDWALGIEARSRALLSDGPAAEILYQESITRLARTRLGPDLARAHLLFGEWLRRALRRGEARDQLRTAHAMFDAIGMDAFAGRARRELRATGETARRLSARARPATDAGGDLTAQEVQVARLAREGQTNPEIASRLFLSPRTVQYHLSKVFAKLQISSRGELRHTLTGNASEGRA